MSRRVCTTTQGTSVCCAAAQQGKLNQAITFTTRTGAQRCGVCTTRPSQSKRHPGVPVFQFRFLPSATCGIASGRSCAALYAGGQGIGGGGVMLPPVGGGQLPFPVQGGLPF